MTPEEARALWESTKANGRVLDACPGPHAFVDVTPEKNIGKDYRCALCGGRADAVAVAWYKRGLAHGKDEADVDPLCDTERP